MNAYQILANQAKNKTAYFLRNSPVASRRVFIKSCEQYYACLKDIEKDWPNATLTEAKKILVNRLRHEHVIYKQAMRMKLDKQSYTKFFVFCMDDISLTFPWIADEVVRQINRKMFFHNIGAVKNNQSYSFAMQDLMTSNVFTNKSIVNAFNKVTTIL